MNLMFNLLFVILILALSWRGGLSTCVLESDFGFSLNCQFKKSSIFRVRNLGGVKGYVGLGFSVGDELGFGQSLSNLEGNKRRSTNGRSTALSPVFDGDTSVGKKAESGRMYQGVNTRPNLYKSIGLSTIPPFKPIPPAEKVALKPLGYHQVNNTRPARQPIYSVNSIPSFQSLPASTSKIQGSIKAPQAFKAALQQATNNFGMQSALSNYLNANKLSHRTPVIQSSGPQLINVVQAQAQTQSQPQIDRISANSAPVPVKILPTAIPVSNSVTTEVSKPAQDLSSVMMVDTVKTLSHATNVSAEAIAAAINLKQQQLLKGQKTQKIIKTTTTTTTTTERSNADNIRKYPLAAPSRVMNAPREYYPVGYDKNFDDNFVSRVELPETSFYCGEQKHFPGLYADEDLGCMVFHVCAFTDDGLIMKSFLCPESTLFDQSILKCNWWFYVDCKSSKKLYDSNIPISKSYQLMKALSFFSSYNKQRYSVECSRGVRASSPGYLALYQGVRRPYLSVPFSFVVVTFSLINGELCSSKDIRPLERAESFREDNRARLCEGSCEPRPRSDVRSNGYAIKAAHEAQEAQEAQQCAGALAARQVKCQLAEKAQQASSAAEAALSGKLAMVEQLQYQVREAAAVVLEEAASCQQTQMQLQLAMSAAAQAGQLLQMLTTSLQMAQNTFLTAYQTAEGAQQELIEKAALVDAARARANALLRELAVAMQDLNVIRQATYNAQVAATNATNNANRSKRRMPPPGVRRRRRRRVERLRRRRRALRNR